jgi:hypothetical protein
VVSRACVNARVPSLMGREIAAAAAPRPETRSMLEPEPLHRNAVDPSGFSDRQGPDFDYGARPECARWKAIQRTPRAAAAAAATSAPPTRSDGRGRLAGERRPPQGRPARAGLLDIAPLPSIRRRSSRPQLGLHGIRRSPKVSVHPLRTRAQRRTWLRTDDIGKSIARAEREPERG